MFSNVHVMADLKELWSFKSFRARIFMTIVPTILAIVFGHYATDRQRPYDFIAEQSYIIPPLGREGQELNVNWRVVKHRDCPGTVERQLVDPETGVIIAPYDPEPADGDDDADGWIRKRFMLPRVMQRGNIAYQSKLVFHCNWLQARLPTFAIRYTTPQLTFFVEE